MFGWGGERDIFAALDFLEQRPDVDPARIGGIGLSVGGELMLQAAAQDERLAAVVSEGSGTRSMPEELEEYPAVEVALNFPLLVLKTAAVAVFSNTAVPPKLTDLIPQIAPRPTMFIWAPNGGNVEWMNPTYHRLAGENSRSGRSTTSGTSAVWRVIPRSTRSGSWASSTQPCSRLSPERGPARCRRPGGVSQTLPGRFASLVVAAAGASPRRGGAGHTGHPQDPCVPLPRSCAQPHGQVNAERVCWRYAKSHPKEPHHEQHPRSPTARPPRHSSCRRRTIAVPLRQILLRLARHEEDLAAIRAAAVSYWAPSPPSVSGHRAAAEALRSEADRFLQAS